MSQLLYLGSSTSRANSEADNYKIKASYVAHFFRNKIQAEKSEQIYTYTHHATYYIHKHTHSTHTHTVSLTHILDY